PTSPGAAAGTGGRAATSPRGCAAKDAVPPRADAGCELIVALEHVHRFAQAAGGGLDADRARFDTFPRCHPQPVVAPHAGTEGHLFGLPAVDVDDTPAPAVLDHES